MSGPVNEVPHAAPPRATFRQKIGGPGGISTLLVALAAGALGLGIPVLWQLRRVLARARSDDRRPAEAILVLGRLLEDDRPSRVFVGRLAHAAALWRAGLAPRLIVAGGLTGRATRTEAAAGRDWLLAAGVPPEAVWTEEHSQHTLENLVYVRATLRAQGLGSLLLVSDPLHPRPRRRHGARSRARGRLLAGARLPAATGERHLVVARRARSVPPPLVLLRHGLEPPDRRRAPARPRHLSGGGGETPGALCG